ncbi:MAG TPA: hypothetical protein VFD43_06060 [Planctomycetota bacterium]|nr:hypothetical protein [Planctomycetota bacterium]
MRKAADERLQAALDFSRVTRHTGWKDLVRDGVGPARPEADFLVPPANVASVGALAPGLAAHSAAWTDPAGTVVLEAPRD